MIATTSVLALLVPNRPVARIAVVIGALSVVFFSFGSLADILILAGIQRGTVWLAVWLAIFVATGWLGWLLSRRTSAQLVTTVVALALLSWPTVELAAARLTGAGNRATEPASGSVTAPPHASRTKPNVYWFLLDGYARDDSLKHYFDHDNGPFLRYLAERGFRVAEASYSNYDNTTFSLTTTLNTGYRYLPGASRPDSAAQVSALSGYNPVVRKFVSLGYRYIHAPYAGAAKTQCGGSEDRCIRARPSGRIPLNEIQVNLLQLTPLFRVLRQALQGAFRYDHIFVEDVMAALGKSEPSPFFLFAHILSPHAPPRYTENCERLDGVTATIDVGEGVYSPTQFRTDTVCTNRSVERAVAEIAKRDSSDPIIILQGDHGF